MAGWWEGLSAWNQASYFVAGFGLAYLVSVVPWPWDWFAKLPPGSNPDEGEGDVGVDLSSVSLDAFGGDKVSNGGDAGGHAGHDGGSRHGGD